MPKEIKVGYSYSALTVYNSSLADRYLKSWRPTSLYDIDPDIGGVQPPGYDQICALYNLYRVDRFEIEVTVENFSTLESVLLAIFPMPSTTITASVSQIQTVPNVKFTTIPALGCGSNVRTLKYQMSALDLLKTDIPASSSPI